MMDNDDNADLVEDKATEDMTPEASLSLGDSLYVDEAYDLAVDAYAAALALSGDTNLQRRALSHRSAAFYQLKRYEDAREDAQTAVDLPIEGSPLRAGEAEVCHKRLGMALLRLERLAEAKVAFEQASQLATLNGRDASHYQEWIRQCQPKIVQKSPPASSTPTAPVVTPLAPTLSSQSTVNRRPTMPKYQYYQSDTVMTIAILEPNVHQDQLQVSFAPKKLTVRMQKGGTIFTVIHGPLFDSVDVDRCRIQIRDDKVLLKLRKQSPHNWHELLGKEESASPPAEKPKETTPVKVEATKKVTPYASHRDWDAIERDLTQEEQQETPQGDEALNKLFRDIYGKSDEDTRRAMVKSFQTSGGTVLSTNWDEVAKKDYEKERPAPKGMEWKTWEGDKLPEHKED